ncbi:hypothetical protein THRCLA_01853 [Thraustotheca clavata]|uniref:Uncharacterized protein n=1 Tax=Thraustotheca clavata TaxID=74557 RepID=A0A1W0A768_9STRA|nr:hypothetical protein THRCLA_01853 [Thraustotheca clavata]
MHRAEKTSSRVCRERELEVARAVHRKKLQETRSAIDSHKPQTMYHLLHNMKREREINDRKDEIERHNHLLVNRMTDVMNCSSWEFHPSPASAVNTVSYTVYHSPRHSPRKPCAPSPTKKSLNSTFRTQKLQQIQQDNMSIKNRVRNSNTHYKNSKLRKDWEQSVKYLKSICAFPLLKPSPQEIGPIHGDLPLENPVEFMKAQSFENEENDLLDYYNMSLPTIVVKPRTPPSLVHRCLRRKKPCFEPKKVGFRPGLPILDPTSPRFKWGPSSPKFTKKVNVVKPPSNFLFKNGRLIDGAYFVLTVTSAKTYGMTIKAYDGETCRSYDLYVSKDNMLRLLQDVISIREEFAVETISCLLCDRLRFQHNMLYIELKRIHPNCFLKQTSIFCLIQPLVLDQDRYLATVTTSEAEDSLLFTLVHNRSRTSYSMTKSYVELASCVRTYDLNCTALDTAATALLSYLVISNGQLLLRTRKLLWQEGLMVDGTYYLLSFYATPDDRYMLTAYNPSSSHTIETIAPSTMKNLSPSLVLANVSITSSKELVLGNMNEDIRPSTADQADSVLSKLAQMETEMRLFIQQNHNKKQIPMDDEETKRNEDMEMDEEEEDEVNEDIDMDSSATIIQAHIRGTIVRRNTMELRKSLGMRVDESILIANQHEAATKIQAHIRGTLTRRKSQMGHNGLKLPRMKDEVRPLPVFPGKNLSIDQEQGLSRIQAHIRGSYVRNHLRDRIDEPIPHDLIDTKHHAATQIQARFRGTLCRNNHQAYNSSVKADIGCTSFKVRGSIARRPHDHEHEEVVPFQCVLYMTERAHHRATVTGNCLATAVSSLKASPVKKTLRSSSAAPGRSSSPPPLHHLLVSPNACAPTTCKTPHVKITDIVNRNRQKTASSADLIKSFECAVRKVVDTKRSEADKLQFILVKRTEEIEKAKLQLQDLKRDCQALGLLDNTKETERLQVIASFSRRPIYSKHTKIHDLEEKFAQKTTEIHSIVRKILSYEHIKRRHETEKSALLLHQHKLTHELWEKNQRIQELHRLEIVANEALNNTQSRLAELKGTIAKEVRLFETELSQRKRWLREKAKFHAFYEQQMESIPEIVGNRQLPSNNPPTITETHAHKRWSFPMVVKAIELSRYEDKRCEDAFRKIGVHGDRVNPTEIIAIYQSHMQLKEELLARQAQQIDHITTVKQRIEIVKEELQQSQLKATRRRDKGCEAVQKQLSLQEKRLSHAKEEYEYIQQIVQPVKAGIQQIVSQVTAEGVNVDNIKSIEIALEHVEREMLTLMEQSCTNMNEDGGPTTNNVKPTPPLKKAATLASWTKPSEITSPYNVRVKPKEDLNTLHHLTESPSKHHKLAITPATLSVRDLEDITQDVVYDGVMDRNTVKQISSTIFAMNKKKRDTKEST